MSARQSLARRVFSALAEGTADPPGVTRAAYGPSEQAAHDLARHEAEALGCEIAIDPAGNLLMTLPGSDRRAQRLLLGSHLDSVPHGGNYDGAAGVVAGLALIAEARARGFMPPRDVTVVAFRAEEAAWFPLSYLGSEAALGRLAAALLETPRSDTGQSLAEHMRAAGFDPEGVARGEALLRPDDIGAFVEVHIEQGPVLVGADLPLGLVTAINGGFRYMQARAVGAWDHSGATPRRHRQDAVLGLTDLVTGLEAAWDRIEAAGQAVTLTFGQVATDPALHGGSRVAGEVAFSLDVRGADAGVLDELRRDCARLRDEIAETRGVVIDFGPEFTWPVARMTPALIARLEACAQTAGIPILRMPSGAGHDAAVMAGAGIASAMLFVRNAEGSHNPDEAMDLDDFAAAVSVLWQFLNTWP